MESVLSKMTSIANLSLGRGGAGEASFRGQAVRGFTLVELIIVLVFVGIIGAMVYRSGMVHTVSNSANDIAVIKTALRQMQIRAMSSLPTETWSVTGTANSVTICDNSTSVVSYTLSGTTGAFSASFNSIGQLQSSSNIPSAISIDTETGYIP
jgi:prepilin-type N-terminal cleavage/methylation domain-containing protein